MEKVKKLIQQAKELGYVVTLMPKKKLVRLHGFKMYTIDEAIIELNKLVSKGR